MRARVIYDSRIFDKNALIGKAILVRVSRYRFPAFCYDYDSDSDKYHCLKIRKRKERDDIRCNWIIYVGSNGLKYDGVAMVSVVVPVTTADIDRILGFIGYAKVQEVCRKIKAIENLERLENQDETLKEIKNLLNRSE